MVGFNSNDVMRDLQGFFKPGEIEAIYNSCSGARDKLLIRLLWKSGRRIGEVLQLKVKDIDSLNSNILWHIEKKSKRKLDDKGNFITWEDNKGKTHYRTEKINLTRWKPCDKETMKQIMEYLAVMELGSEAYLFTSTMDFLHPITRQRAFQIIRAASKKASVFYVGSKQPHPHHFRHSFAVELSKKLKSPADVRQLQQWLEHSNLEMTEQYLQFDQSDMRRLIEDDS